MENVGTQFIDELGRRGLQGIYFDYAGYRTLHQIDTMPELVQFLKDQRIKFSDVPADPIAAVDAVQQYTARRHGRRVALLYLCFLPFILWTMLSDLKSETLHINDWQGFNQHRVSEIFQIPAEATSVSAMEYDYYFGGSEFLVVFDLPQDRPPEEWVRRIVNDSGFSGRDRESACQSQYHYSYKDGSGEDTVQYCTKKKRYIVSHKF